MSRLEHANIASAHPQELTEFLKAAFPTFRIRGSGIGGNGLGWRHVGDDEFYVAITTTDPKSMLERQPYANSVGFNHLGWEVEDVIELEHRMNAAGFSANLIEHDHPARLRSYFYDPDGNDWEFVQYLTDDRSQRNSYDP